MLFTLTLIQNTLDSDINISKQYSIAFIAKLYRGGGLERVTQLLSTYLSQQNIGVFLITGEPTEHDFQVPDNVRRLVAFAENDGIREDTPSEENLRRMQAKNELLLQYHRDHDIQLFVCQEHWAHGNYETINFLKDHGIKVIAIEHNFFLFPFYDDREYLFKIFQQDICDIIKKTNIINQNQKYCNMFLLTCFLVVQYVQNSKNWITRYPFQNQPLLKIEIPDSYWQSQLQILGKTFVQERLYFILSQRANSNLYKLMHFIINQQLMFINCLLNDLLRNLSILYLLSRIQQQLPLLINERTLQRT
ncbi:Glycosyl_transferases group [Hexamita inflata]|uniref:Glycosyl transferases group n=1 Tax=Hexamita inflata TaxID=28002 RepID=A0AA86UH20_9EUKA|nr:Glycosyl transferases group [Hexamita inflata]